MSAQTPLKNQLQASLVVERAIEVFQELFGAEGGAAAKPLFLKNRTLTVTCATGAIAQEIRLKQLEIVAKINEKIGKKEVDRIRYLA
jgi:predicted nucleic acid-binding Zn ribbon protein